MNSKAIKRQLLAAIAMVLVAAIALGSSTYAWFAANDRVTATGLKATAQTGSSALLIAENKDGITDNDFKTTVELNAAATRLAPVSTVNGTKFFWTPGTNVKGDGDAINNTYTEYNETDFKRNFSNAVGYIEYDLLLKATFTEAKSIGMTELGLKYNKASDNSNAFRVAFFASDPCSTAKLASEETPTLVSIMDNGKDTTKNFDADKAVASTTEIGTVLNASEAALVIEGNETQVGTNYYHVIVRLWIEGEDNTCRTEVFSPLDGEWNLSLAFEAYDKNADNPPTPVTNYTATVTTEPVTEPSP